MSKRVLSAIVALVLLSATIGPAVAQQSAADADLSIRQPEYVDGAVERFSADGLTGYRVAGPEQLIRPQNFDPDDVVNAGVATQGGQLSYDRSLGVYVFDPQGNEGTFELFWTVEQTVQQDGENGSQPVTERRQYEAAIRVTGKAAMEHQPAGTTQQAQADAQKWREFNSTVSDIRESDLLLQGSAVTNDQIVESALNLYVTARDPPRALQGGFTQFHVLVLLGGVGFTAAVLFWAFIGIRAWYKERKRNQRYEAIEDAEGELNERLRALDEEQRRQAFNNWEWRDIVSNDHLADGLRALGDTPREAYERLSNEILLPEVWIRDKLATMGADGYVAVVDERDDGDIVDAHLAPHDDVDDSAEIVELQDELPDSLFPIVTNDQKFRSFDLRKADVEPTDVEGATTLDIDALHEELDRQLDWFDDPEQGAELLYEFVDTVADSPYSDDDGTPIATRRALNEYLHEASLLRDTFAFGLPRQQANLLEFSLSSYDPAAAADKFRHDVEDGRV